MIDPTVKAKILEDLAHLSPDLQQRAQELVHELAVLESRDQRARRIPWAGIINDPGMVTGEAIEDALKEGWADAICSDRG